MDATRRQFLKTSAAGVAAAAATRAVAMPLYPHPAAGRAPGGVSAWSTYANKRYVPAPVPDWSPVSRAADAKAIVFDPATRYQPILGFGAAFTDAACYMFAQLTPAAREELFHELFHPSQSGLSVCRTCIGASDYSRTVYSFDEGEPDPELANFSLAHDREYILPILREARRANPDLFLFSSPWSPPGWMKPNRSMLGGCMQRKYMAAYANYFVKFLRGYEAEGVPVQAVTVQNEVDTEQDGKMPACAWPQEYEADFVRRYLGPAFVRDNLKSKIWILDHNYSLWGRAIGELETPGLRQFCNAIAWHGYVGQPEMMSRVHQAYPEVEMYWTEGGPDYTAKDYLTDWAAWSETYAGILRNWCRSITGWNLALDELGRPNLGPFSCGGMVTIHSQTKQVTRSGQYWAFAHYSRVIRRGARRIESHADLAGVQHVAFENPDHSYAAVVTNKGPAMQARLQVGKFATSLRLEPDSVTSLLWS